MMKNGNVACTAFLRSLLLLAFTMIVCAGSTQNVWNRTVDYRDSASLGSMNLVSISFKDSIFTIGESLIEDGIGRRVVPTIHRLNAQGSVLESYIASYDNQEYFRYGITLSDQDALGNIYLHLYAPNDNNPYVNNVILRYNIQENDIVDSIYLDNEIEGFLMTGRLDTVINQFMVVTSKTVNSSNRTYRIIAYSEDLEVVRSVQFELKTFFYADYIEYSKKGYFSIYGDYRVYNGTDIDSIYVAKIDIDTFGNVVNESILRNGQKLRIAALAHTVNITQDSYGFFYIVGLSDIASSYDYIAPVLYKVSEDWSSVVWSDTLFKEIEYETNLIKVNQIITDPRDESVLMTGTTVLDSNVDVVWIAKYSSNGDQLWKYDYLPLGYSRDDVVESELFRIKVYYDNGYLVTGRYAETVNSRLHGWVMRLDSNGCESVKCVDSLTNVDEAIRNSLEVYPNPTSGTINIAVSGYCERCIILVFDMLGNIVFGSQPLTSKDGVVELDVGDRLEHGTYILAIQDERFNTLLSPIVITGR